MNLLWVATKAPWPPADGGRLLQLLTLRALAEEGVRVTVVAPAGAEAPAPRREGSGPEGGEPGGELAFLCRLHLVPARPRSRPLALLAAVARREPVTVARHRLEPVRRTVARLLEEGNFQAVHCEQVQALPQAAPARGRGVPVVLRAQNVESDLWAAAARLAFDPFGLGRREARRLARWEGGAVARATLTLALTARDAERLAALAAAAGSAARVEHLPAPFPAELPAGPRPLPGEPAVVLIGGGWPPNRDSARWFTAAVWPQVRSVLPAARLHLFGADRGDSLGGSPPPGVVPHPPPARGASFFAPGSVLAVPLRVASGVRMKILEAWARGVPVVATPEAAAGLEAEDGRQLLLASTPAAFANALRRLRDDPALPGALTAAGRALLRRHHHPAALARRLAELYRKAGEVAPALPPL